MYWRLDDSYETWQGNGLEIAQCCNFVRFKIYILVSVIIHLIQRRYFVFGIVPQSALQLERLVPALGWDNCISSRSGYSVSSKCCTKKKKAPHRK